MAAGAQAVADQAHPGVADEDVAGPQPPSEVVRRQETGVVQSARHDGGMADLGKAGQVERRRRRIRRQDEVVETLDEGADGGEDHKSGPDASTALGKCASFSGHCTTKRSLKR